MAKYFANGEGLSHLHKTESRRTSALRFFHRKIYRKDRDDHGLEGGSGLRFEEQTQDPEIFKKFNNINSKILNWSSYFANDTYVDFNLMDNQEVIKRFFEIAPNEDSSTKALSDLLRTKIKKRLFIQGWIWLVLVKDIFQYFTDDGQQGSDGKDFWMSEQTADAVKTLERAFQADGQKHVSIEDYNNWRAFTFALMSDCERSQLKSRPRSRDIERLRVSQYSARKSQDLAQKTMDIAKPWMVEKDIERLQSNLNDIIKSAIDFSRLLRCQRACWSVYYPKPLSVSPNTKLRIDNSTMKQQSGKEDTSKESKHNLDSGTEPRQVLELFITPALFKRGDTDGNKYEHNSCMKRAIVTCKEPV